MCSASVSITGPTSPSRSRRCCVAHASVMRCIEFLGTAVAPSGRAAIARHSTASAPASRHPSHDLGTIRIECRGAHRVVVLVIRRRLLRG
jgi:hypothetical protein